jgi:hypothetical protein
MNNDNAPQAVPTTIVNDYKTSDYENTSSNEHYSFFSEKSLIKILSLIPAPKPRLNSHKETPIINPIPAKKTISRRNSMDKSSKNSYSNRCISSNNSKSKLKVRTSNTNLPKPSTTTTTRNDRKNNSKLSHKKQTNATSSSSLNTIMTKHSNSKLNNHKRIGSCTSSSHFPSSEFNVIKKPKPNCIVTTISIKDIPTINNIINHNINKIAATCPTSYKSTINTDDNKIPKRAQILSYQQMFRKKIGNLKHMNSNKLPKPSYTTYMQYKTNGYSNEQINRMELIKNHSAHRKEKKDVVEFKGMGKPVITKRIPVMNYNHNNKSSKHLGIDSIKQIIRNQLNEL